MTKPKEALKACIEDLQTIRDGFSDGTIALAKAAIPVAELHEKAVESLKQHKFIMTSNYSSPNYEDWAIMRNALLAKIEELP